MTESSLRLIVHHALLLDSVDQIRIAAAYCNHTPPVDAHVLTSRREFRKVYNFSANVQLVMRSKLISL